MTGVVYLMVGLVSLVFGVSSVVVFIKPGNVMRTQEQDGRLKKDEE